MQARTSANANINIRVNNDIKNRAQVVFANLGLDMTSAVNIFLRQVIRKNGIPFELINDKQARRSIPQLGCIKGKIWESDGYDWFEESENFKEYM